MNGDTEDAGSPTSSHSSLSRLLEWLVFEGDRLAVTAVLLAVELCVLLALGFVGLIGVDSPDAVRSLFSSVITGLFALVTITISINQLILSRILGSPHEIEERIDSVETFRDRMEEMNLRRDVSPIEPPVFLRFTMEILREHTELVEAAFAEVEDPSLERRTSDLVDALMAVGKQVTETIDRKVDADEQLDLYDTLSPILNNKYSKHLHTARAIRSLHGDDLTPNQRTALDELVQVLRDINLTRHYLKTLYTHIELSSLTQMMLVTGLPAFIISVIAMFSYGSQVVPTVADPLRLVVVNVLLTLATVPLVILVSYVTRITAVAKRTTTYGTFVPTEELP